MTILSSNDHAWIIKTILDMLTWHA